MQSHTTLSTVIDARVKRAASEYCRKHGMKLQYFVEQSLVEQLEDEMDIAAYHARRDEKTVPLATVLASRRRSGRS